MARVHRSEGFYAGAVEAVDLADLKKAELVALAEAKGIDSSGKVDELRARLEAGGESSEPDAE
jgi:hypothetical protein